MGKNDKVKASDIANFLNAKLFGKNINIENAVPIHSLSPNSLSFVKKFEDSYINLINENHNSLIICNEEYKDKIKSSFIISDNPRLDFLRVIKEFFTSEHDTGIHPTANVHPDSKIGKKVFIGAHVNIGPEVSIGDNTIIEHNVVIMGKVIFGKGCVVKSNSVIGAEGFGFEYNEYGIPEHFPHIGSIEIGDNVWIGACSTIERATIDRTIISSNVKIDDLVQVGHNCFIGNNTLIMAGSIICGGAKIGSNCWIAPNTSIKEKLKLGDNAFTGLGAVVINDVPNNTKMVGNPAKELKKPVRK